MMFFTRKKGRKRSRRSETIVEVIVAIFVVAVGSAASTSLVVDALRSNGISRDNLIAINLAVEGMEAIRNIRDSNWLEFNYDRDHCWNMKPDATACSSDFSSDFVMPGTNYKPYFNPATMAWKLLPATSGASLDLKNGPLANSEFLLSYLDVDPATDSDGDGNKTNDHDLFGPAASGLTVAGPSKFYRMISISYPTNSPGTDQAMTVTSVVQWQDGTVHQVKIVTMLTNYMKVKVT